MTFRNRRFDKIREVDRVLASAPVEPDYDGMSREVRDLVVNLSLEHDHMAGFASYYLSETSPAAAESAEFLSLDCIKTIRGAGTDAHQ